MLRERIFLVGVLAFVGLVLMGWFRPSSPDPQEDIRSDEARFFIDKTHSSTLYDMVIVGDSRALRCLAPEIIEQYLPGSRIYNMAFHAGGMNVEMYRQAEKLLSPDSPIRGILLAPTSLAFLPHKKANSQYWEYRRKPRDLVWLYTNFPGLAHFFQPVSPSIYLRRWFDIRPAELLEQEFHTTGWIETDQVPRDDVTDFSEQKEILASYRIDRTLIQEMMAQTSEWSTRGIKVFGLFPPAYQPRVAFEDSILGFNRVEFRRKFAQAGGIWIDLEDTGYVTYDGSHLVAESSRELSRETGRAIASKLQSMEGVN